MVLNFISITLESIVKYTFISDINHIKLSIKKHLPLTGKDGLFMVVEVCLLMMKSGP